MAPTTRPGAQCAGNAAVRSRKLPAPAHNHYGALHKSISECILLRLPPEIRNRIYHFTEEAMHDDPYENAKTPDPDVEIYAWDSDSGYKPYPRRIRPAGAVGGRELRRPLALAQTCKQIRAEYRPFWLSHSRFQVHLNELDSFIQTFYPNDCDFVFAPQELYISYPYDMYSPPDQPSNLTLLIRFHAHCPAFTCKFRPAEMLEFHRKECPYKYCVPWYCQFERNYKYYLGLMDCMAYTEVYRSFIMNPNQAWIEDAKATKFDILCSFEEDPGDAKFHIRPRYVLDNGCQPRRHAEELLARWNMEALEYAEHMSFAFEFEINEGNNNAGKRKREVLEVSSKASGDSGWFTMTQHYL